MGYTVTEVRETIKENAQGEQTRLCACGIEKKIVYHKKYILPSEKAMKYFLENFDEQGYPLCHHFQYLQYTDVCTDVRHATSSPSGTFSVQEATQTCVQTQDAQGTCFQHTDVQGRIRKFTPNTKTSARRNRYPPRSARRFFSGAALCVCSSCGITNL